MDELHSLRGTGSAVSPARSHYSVSLRLVLHPKTAHFIPSNYRIQISPLVLKNLHNSFIETPSMPGSLSVPIE
jgi:hypothetical protein